MKNYKVKTPRLNYLLQSESKDDLRKLILEKENITFEEVIEIAQKTFKMYNQLDYPKTKLGYSNVCTIASDGCFLTCITSVYQYLTGITITPPEMNEKLKKAGCFNGALLIFPNVCKALNWNYVGAFRGIGEAPEDKGIYTPTIKEVDYSYRAGKQQHFVVRIYDKNGNYIMDSLGGVKRAINYYEKLVKDERWSTKYFSYRVFGPNEK